MPTTTNNNIANLQFEVQLAYFLLLSKSQPGQTSQRFKEFYNYITSNTVITHLY